MDLVKKIAAKNLWAQLLAFAPSVQPHQSMLLRFAQAIVRHDLTNDWCVPVYFIHQLKDSLNENQIKELLFAAVMRWGLQGLEHIPAKGILMASEFLPNIGIGLRKNERVTSGHRLISVKLKNVRRNAYLVTQDTEQWSPRVWVPISLPVPLCSNDLRDIVF